MQIRKHNYLIFLPEIKKSPQTIHVIYFWKALGTRTPMTMFWSVRHANTQIQIQIRKYTQMRAETGFKYLSIVSIPPSLLSSVVKDWSDFPCHSQNRAKNGSIVVQCTYPNSWSRK